MAISGSCLCGATKFEIDVAPQSVTACNCSFCTKRGGLWAYVKPDQFRLLTPIENAAQWSRVELNHHYFCPTCGCSTFGDTPDWSAFLQDAEAAQDQFDPTRRHIAINVRVLDDFDFENLPVEHVDGRSGW